MSYPNYIQAAFDKTAFGRPANQAAVAVPLAPYILPAVGAVGGAIATRLTPEGFAAIPHDLSNWAGNVKYNLQDIWNRTIGFRPSNTTPISPQTRPVEVNDATVNLALPSWISDVIESRRSYPKGFKKKGDIVVLPGGTRVDTADVETRNDSTFVKGHGVYDKRGVKIQEANNSVPQNSGNNPDNKPDKPKKDKNWVQRHPILTALGIEEVGGQILDLVANSKAYDEVKNDENVNYEYNYAPPTPIGGLVNGLSKFAEMSTQHKVSKMKEKQDKDTTDNKAKVEPNTEEQDSVVVDLNALWE